MKLLGKVIKVLMVLLLSLTMMITVNIINQDSNKTVYADDVPAADSKTISITYTVNPIVKFDLDGGSGDFQDKEVTYGEKLTEPSNKPTRSGYTFDKWLLGDTAYDFNSAVEDNITLKAKWTKNPDPTPAPTPKPVTPTYALPKTGIEGFWTPFNETVFCTVESSR